MEMPVTTACIKHSSRIHNKAFLAEIRGCKLPMLMIGSVDMLPAGKCGIDERMIEGLLQDFYAAIRADGLLGPIFEARIPDWGAHIRRMSTFWCAVAQISANYRGQPLPLHVPLRLGSTHFERWHSLFARSARRTCPQEAAEYLIGRAATIAHSLEAGIGDKERIAAENSSTTRSASDAGGSFRIVFPARLQ